MSTKADGPLRDPLERTRQVAVDVAREAGQLLLQGWGTRPAVSFKSEDINLVTEYDRRSEALIVERLAAAFPEDRIVGRGRHDPRRRDRRAARLVRRSARRHDQLRARHAAVFGVARAVHQPATRAGRHRSAGAWLVVRRNDHGRRLDVQRQADRSVARRSSGGRAAGHRLPVRTQSRAEQHGRMGRADGGGAGDAPPGFGGAGPLLRGVRLARRLLGTRAASVGSRRRRRHRAGRGRACQ